MTKRSNDAGWAVFFAVVGTWQAFLTTNMIGLLAAIAAFATVFYLCVRITITPKERRDPIANHRTRRRRR